MKDAVQTALELVCALTRHAGGCGVLNSHWYLFYDERRDDFRLTVRNRLTYPVWRWVIRDWA